MKKLLHKLSVVTGALFGLTQSLLQLDIFKTENAISSFEGASILPLVIFGLCAPPILVYLNAKFNHKPKRFMGTFHRYVNIYAMMIVGTLSFGIYGLFIFGEPSRYVTVISSFFMAGAFGFMIGYFLDTKYGYKANHNA